MASVKATSLNTQATELLEHFSQKISNLATNLDNSFNEALELILNTKGKLVFCGLGKTGHLARLICSSFQSVGLNAVFLHANEANHGDMGIVNPSEDLVLYFSFSGKSPDIYNIHRSVEPKKTILFTHNVESQLGKIATVCLDIHTKITDEAWPLHMMPTTSLVTMLSLAYTLLMCVCQQKGISVNTFAANHPAGNLGKLLNITVETVMRPKSQLPMCAPTDTVLDLLSLMTSGLCGCVIIEEQGSVMGIFTDGDLRRTIEQQPDLNIAVLNVANQSYRTCSTSTLAKEALQTMQQHAITSLLVFSKQNQFVGLVHIHDLLKLFS